MIIRRANDLQNVQQRGGYRQWIEHLVLARWPGFVVSWDRSEVVMTAEIIRSNWVAKCPHCQTPIIVDPGDLLFCPDCLMQAGSFLAVSVMYPPDAAEIERLLLRRPNPMNRNWFIGETIDDLAAENAEHGVN